MKKLLSLKTFLFLSLFTIVCWGIYFSLSTLAKNESYPLSTLKEAEKKINGGKGHYIVDEKFTTSIGDIKKIKLETASAEIIVDSIEGDEVKVELSGRINPQKEPIKLLKTSEESGRLEILVDQNNTSRTTSRFFNISYGNVKLKVGIPKSFVNDLEVRSSSGDVEIENLTLKKLNARSSSGEIEIANLNAHEAEAETSSGDIEIESLTVTSFEADSSSGKIKVKKLTTENANLESTSGDLIVDGSTINALKLNSTSGEIKIRESKVEVVDAKSTSGDLRLSEISKKVTAQTTSGDIKVSSLNELPKINLKSHSGDVRVSLIKNASFHLDLQTFSGDLRGNLSLPVDLSERKSLNHRIGEGLNAGEVSLRTSSGDLVITL